MPQAASRLPNNELQAAEVTEPRDGVVEQVVVVDEGSPRKKRERKMEKVALLVLTSKVTQ